MSCAVTAVVNECPNPRVQLTATLRILANCALARRQLSPSAAIPQLCVALEQRSGDKDVCIWIVSVLRYVRTQFCVPTRPPLSKEAGPSAEIGRFTLNCFLKSSFNDSIFNDIVCCVSINAYRIV